jgi:hypothetical protein
MFKISPVVTLMILYVGHKLLGLWGMVLGVPISVFLFRHVILGTDAANGTPVAPACQSPAEPSGEAHD